jgi:hypothetical protein
VSPLLRGVAIAAVHVALIGAVAGKLLYDRATLPRAWVETAGVDPDLPIRGRYVALNVLVPIAQDSPMRAPDRDHGVAFGRIEVRAGTPVAVLQSDGAIGDDWSTSRQLAFAFHEQAAGVTKVRLVEPVAFFLPDDAPDPTRDVRPGELWLEASFPPRSPPRPIRLERRR